MPETLVGMKRQVMAAPQEFRLASDANLVGKVQDLANQGCASPV
jgi:hypothetical protein